MDGFNQNTKITFEEIIKAVKESKCILFLGAGVHAPPPEGGAYTYPEDERPPMSWRLSEILAEECDFAQNFPNDSIQNLERVSLCYELTFGRKQLVDRLREFLRKNKKPSPVLKMLMELPFPIIVTTNFDDLAESALRSLEKNPEVFSYDHTSESKTLDMSDDPTFDAPMVFKMHGDLSNRDRDSIVITDEDYINFIQRMTEKESPVPLTILFKMRRWPILFVGYSLKDYNLRLLFRTLRWKVDPSSFPRSFSVDMKPDPLILQVWQNERKFITFLTENIWSFIPNLYTNVTGKENAL